MQLIFTLLMLIMAVSSVLSAESIIARDGYRLKGTDSGGVELLNSSGRLLATVHGYKIDEDRKTTGGPLPEVISQDDGQALKVAYKTSDSKLSVTGTFRLCPKGVVKALFDIKYPEDGRPVGGGLLWQVADDAVKGSYSKLGRWMVGKHGGAPYEEVDGYYRQWQFKDEALFSATESGNEDYTTTSYCDCPPKKTADGSYTATAFIIVTKPDTLPAEAAAIGNGRPVSLELLQDRTYNLWESNAEPIPLRFRISNVSGKPQKLHISCWARDFNGNIIGEREYTKYIDSAARLTETASFRAPWKRGIMYAEVRVKAGECEEFARTTLSVLPPHKFRGGKESIFGMAAYWPLPTEKDTFALMQRLGVRWVRSGDNRKLNRYGINAMHHMSFAFDRDKGAPDARREFMKQSIQTARVQKNDIIELGNEFNYYGGHQKGESAKEYCDTWLRPFVSALSEEKYKARVMCTGLGGPDLVFLRRLHEAGGWDLFDLLSLHTGRGNYTADFLPADDGEFWTYLGSIRRVKKTLGELGQKPIWITEAYACTVPNDWWFDTHHCAPENVLLSYALGIAEGIECIMWYQLNDSVWFDKGGICTTNMEYHFGLLNRDLSLKASALAYRNAAEVFDQAKFLREMKFDDPQNKGLMFTTPDGPVAVLWNRAEGYILTEQKPDYVNPEPWVSRWKTKTTVKLPAASKDVKVRILDAIGGETTAKASNGVVEITLNGAPVVVYGLSGEAGNGRE